MMKNLLWIALPLILFSGLKCDKPNKEDPQPKPEDTLYANDTFLRYWYFPKGSWWVYKRMDTNARVYDTVRVFYTSREMKYDPPNSIVLSFINS